MDISPLYEALGAQYGIVLQCEGSRKEIREKLYALRKESNDPDLDCLAITDSPTDASHLWIVKVEK